MTTLFATARTRAPTRSNFVQSVLAHTWNVCVEPSVGGPTALERCGYEILRPLAADTGVALRCLRHLAGIKARGKIGQLMDAAAQHALLASPEAQGNHRTNEVHTRLPRVPASLA